MTTTSTRRAFAFAITFTAIAALVACGGDGSTKPPPSSGKITSEISECGGFEANASGGSYCDAEKVAWKYDAAQRTLTIEDQRVTLNCCGARSVDVTRGADGAIVVREIDKPENGGARCRCECTYDFRVTVRDVDSAATPVRIEREVTDAGPADTIYDQTIDLSAGSGDAVVDATKTSFCSPKAPSALFEAPRVSECGGFVANARAKSSNGDAGSYSGAYCDAEVLDWSLDPQTGRLSLSNNRTLLNCCGKHSVAVRKEGTRYVISETDAPDNGARCNCMCVFDFAVDLTSITAKSIDIAIERTVTDDSSGTQTVYTGTLDLTGQSGTVVVDSADIGPWCENH